jgi:hypothetical protein
MVFSNAKRIPWPHLLAAAACITAGPAPAAAPAAPRPRISFNNDIRPILSDNCFACHGPDSANRQAGLRLDTAEQATAELESGSRAIVPEDVAASELVARIISDDPDSVMPPPEAKIGRLTAEQVDLLKQWIAEGAKYEPHWAFVAPVKPEATDATAATTALDEAVVARLAKRGLAQQPEADRATLIRRAAFDITGLPPTPADVEAFVADTSPDAYENSSTACSQARATASAWPPTGSTSPATPTAMAFRSIASGPRCGRGATG